MKNLLPKKVFLAAVTMVITPFISNQISASTQFNINCEVTGILDKKKWELKTLIDHSFKFSESEIPPQPKPLKNSKKTTSCTPTGLKSKTIFSAKKGLSIQVSAYKCGNHPTYFTQKVTLKGQHPVIELLSLDANKKSNSSRIRFNEPGVSINPKFIKAAKGETLTPSKPINLPEGTFKSIASDCKVQKIKQ